MRKRQFIADPRALSVLIVVATLVPAQVGLSTLRPVPVLRARGDAPILDPSAGEVEAGTANNRDDDRADSIAMLAAALEDCPNALPPALRLRIARVIHEQSEEYGYDPLFITALVQVESGCSVTARGGEALGLVQLLPSTARGVARRAGLPWRGERSLTEPSMSIQLGLRYLDELEDQLGDTYRAVAAYNLGPARVAHMSSGRARRTVYVRKILTRYEQLLELYA
jgi:soluble lytic murein transglycosylase-like protein